MSIKIKQFEHHKYLLHIVLEKNLTIKVLFYFTDIHLEKVKIF